MENVNNALFQCDKDIKIFYGLQFYICTKISYLVMLILLQNYKIFQLICTLQYNCKMAKCSKHSTFLLEKGQTSYFAALSQHIAQHFH